MNLLSRKKQKPKVEIYSKPDCHLCDEAKTVLQRVRSRRPFEMIDVDITNDQRLYNEYKEQIPVIFINGRKACKFRVDEKEFVKKLKQVI